MFSVFEPLRGTGERKVWKVVYCVSLSGPDSVSDRKEFMNKSKVAAVVSQ